MIFSSLQGHTAFQPAPTLPQQQEKSKLSLFLLLVDLYKKFNINMELTFNLSFSPVGSPLNKAAVVPLKLIINKELSVLPNT